MAFAPPPPSYTTRMPRVFLIDTDTASDDAVALIMALRTPGVHVAAITIVAGNVPLDQATRNALYTAELCNSDVPIFPGATRPLIRPYQHAQWFHGNDGLGDQGYPPPRSRPEPRPAVDATPPSGDVSARSFESLAGIGLRNEFTTETERNLRFKHFILVPFSL